MKTGLVLLNYNDFQSTLNLLKRIKDYNAIDDICIVDNCSTNDSLTELRRYENSRIHVIANRDNRGYAAGNNVGCRYLIENRQSDYVIIANPDVFFEEEAVIKIVRAFQENPDYVILSAVVHDIDGKISKKAYLELPTYWDDLFSCFYLYNKFHTGTHLSEIKAYEEIMRVDAVLGSMWVIRADVLKKIDYMDENTFLFYEEYCTSMRIRRLNAGHKIGLLTSAEYTHNHSVSIKKSLSEIRTFIIYMRSKTYFEKQYHHLNFAQVILLHAATKISICEKVLFEAVKGLCG